MSGCSASQLTSAGQVAATHSRQSQAPPPGSSLISKVPREKHPSYLQGARVRTAAIYRQGAQGQPGSTAGLLQNPVQREWETSTRTLLGAQLWKGPRQTARLCRRPQEGTAVGLRLSFLCRKLRRGFWVLAFCKAKPQVIWGHRTSVCPDSER